MTTTSDDMTQTALSPPSAVDEEYYWDFVTFSVDDVLYRLPKYRFVNGSETFASEYGLDQDQGSEEEYAGVEDSPPDAVKKLEVAAADFRALLKVLYPKTDKASHQELTLSTDEWLAVLKLSSKWRFISIRKLAIERLSPLSEMKPSERIRLGREYAVESWLLSGYEELVTRKAVISNEEGQLIGWEPVNELWAVREMWKAHTACTCSTKLSLDAFIQDTFTTEFEVIGELKQQYRTRQEKEEYALQKALEEAKREEAAQRKAENDRLAAEEAEERRKVEELAKEVEDRRRKLCLQGNYDTPGVGSPSASPISTRTGSPVSSWGMLAGPATFNSERQLYRTSQEREEDALRKACEEEAWREREREEYALRKAREEEAWREREREEYALRKAREEEAWREREEAEREREEAAQREAEYNRLAEEEAAERMIVEELAKEVEDRRQKLRLQGRIRGPPRPMKKVQVIPRIPEPCDCENIPVVKKRSKKRD
ncbi:hypothetical protein D9611_003669 [Ephemerocybe angulata]|uniref:Uncharacterized protein n=1 Tax=Ephemerocybe angulata TaxID=980116 RepID=A0A8H5B588_9AGAR|nr:hypothetical protein D9611_003669 [Tulosesus angulatus]